MKVHVAYASDGSLLGGTIIHEDAPAQCRIVASPDYLVRLSTFRASTRPWIRPTCGRASRSMSPIPTTDW
jgi:hypothetical protein